MNHALLLLRHLHTPLNSNTAVERIRGWLDPKIEEEGKRQAKVVAERVAGLQAGEDVQWHLL